MEENHKTRVTVNIYGVPYKLMGSSEISVEMIHRIARHVDEQMREIAGRNRQLDLSRLAVLAAVNMSNDYYLALQELDQLKQQQKELLKWAEQHEQAAAELQQCREQLAATEKRQSQSEQHAQDLGKQLQELTQQNEALLQEKAQNSGGQQEFRDLQNQLQDKENQLQTRDSQLQTLQQSFDALQSEYQKLQSEFDEWIEMAEDD